MIQRKKKWTESELRKAVEASTSVRQVIAKLGLIEAGGNYDQVKKFIRFYNIDTSHFKGLAWNKGMKGTSRPHYSLEQILIRGSTYQSYKLKKRLFDAGIRDKKCELCGWAEVTIDGRLPLELDHINGDRHDNRLDNLRILCPNCHSLQVTHRARNMKKKLGQWRNWYTRNT